MALTDTSKSPIGSSAGASDRHRPQIWVLQYGPCWCRAEPGGTGSFDFVRFRTTEVDGDVLDRDIIIVSDRVITGSTQLLSQVHERVPTPNLVVATGHCPAARQFWEELPGGWSPIEEFLPVDVWIRQCVSGYPETLLASVLESLAGAQQDVESALRTTSR